MQEIIVKEYYCQYLKDKVNFQTLCGDNPTKSEIVKKFNFKNIENNEDKIFESR